MADDCWLLLMADDCWLLLMTADGYYWLPLMTDGYNHLLVDGGAG
jgi:hypothetical protein